MAREESIDDCASRLHRFLHELSACENLFARWYERGNSRREARAVEINFKAKSGIVDLLARGRHRRDSDNSVMEELGFSTGMWNGENAARSVGLSITCGLFSTLAGLGGNLVRLDLPEDLGNLQQCERMVPILTVLATCWEPDWAGVLSLEAMRARRFDPRVPMVDWMLYISRKKCETLTVPDPSIIQTIGKAGSIIVVQHEPPTSDNENVRAIERAVGLC